MIKLPAATNKDAYKADHRRQYPNGTEFIYANLTARSGKRSNIKNGKGIVWSGLQIFMFSYLIDDWRETFFNHPFERVAEKYLRRVGVALNNPDFDVSHLKNLHELGYLPLEIRALPEGSFVPYRVPMMTIINTHPDFAWLVNMIESVMSSELWPVINTGTTCREFLKNFYYYAELTGADKGFVPFQAHDFSMRGMFGYHAAALSAMAAILVGSKGTDTFHGIDLIEAYYSNSDWFSNGFIAGSIPATEHSVMCAGGKETELDTYKRLINEVYPSGNLAIVSDTWDLWNVLDNFLPQLKDDIIRRDGKIVIRPDSGDPVKILCGDLDYINYTDRFFTLPAVEGYLIDEKYEREHYCAASYVNEGEVVEIDTEVFRFNGEYYEFKQTTTYQCWYEHGAGGMCRLTDKNHTITKLVRTTPQKGLIEKLWEIFGGKVNEKGFKVLHPNIGAVYGDSITLERQEQILKQLHDKYFATDCIVLGVGSYTYQYVTRDTHGIAIKTTAAIINGVEHELFKDPITDDGTKKSAKGWIKVLKGENDLYYMEDQQKDTNGGCLEVVFRNGSVIKTQTYQEIRDIVYSGIKKELGI